MKGQIFYRGDEGYEEARVGLKTKITFTTMPFYQRKEPLLPSGLMGPVVIFKK